MLASIISACKKTRRNKQIFEACSALLKVLSVKLRLLKKVDKKDGKPITREQATIKSTVSTVLLSNEY